MTIKDLKDILNMFPDDAEVMQLADEFCCYCPVKGVSIKQVGVTNGIFSNEINWVDFKEYDFCLEKKKEFNILKKKTVALIN